MTKQTLKGQQVEIIARREYSGIVIVTTIDGNHAGIATPYITPLSGITGHPWQVNIASGKQLALTDEQADTLRAEIAAVQERLDQDPAVVLQRLVEQRGRIARKLSDCLAAASRAPYRYEDDIDDHRGWADARKHRADADSARQELAKFDAEHPEALAEIERLKAESIERNQWN